MAKTSVDISFGLVDVTAKMDTTASAVDKQPFINLNDLKLEGVYPPKAATLEQDYWKLDGTFNTFPDNPQDISWGIWSSSMAGGDGRFDAPIVLTLSFQNLHESLGLTFEFNPYDNSFCNDLNIKWYQGTTLLYNLDFAPDSWRYACMQKVENYNKIIISFRSMSKPYRFLKVQNIMHGVIKEFGSTELKTAKVLEEIDLTGLTLSVNTLDFSMFSRDDAFNIFNPSGVYTLLQRKQQLIVSGTKNEEKMHMGTFFVDEMESQTNKILSISAVDPIGIMDGTTFMGALYKNAIAADVVEEIMEGAGFGYALDNALRNKTVTGHIPICSHREALQMLVFSIGGFVSTTRGGTVNIKEIPDIASVPTSQIGMNRKHIGTKVKLRNLVTGVDVVEHNFTLKSTLEEICKVNLEVGSNTITFSEPASNISVSRGTIAQFGVNYCIVNSTAAGECTVSGKKYDDSQKTIQKRLPNIPAGEKELIEKVDCRLIHSINSNEITQRLLDIYQYRIEQSLSFILDRESVGDLADIETEYGVYRGAVVEKLDIDLTGGYVTKAVVVGV
ncbi:hypothetical protein [Anaerotignum sp.]|uniref:hypothetical protein n=1 Tax=Anaerotignum sp. TaxID=2039241 RepID=UPI002897C586|nr:hypothetical protein [Anaerotignum sp.]